MKANWLKHMVRRNCLIVKVIEGVKKGRIKRKRRKTTVLDNTEGRFSYEGIKTGVWNREVEAQVRIVGCGPVTRQKTTNE